MKKILCIIIVIITVCTPCFAKSDSIKKAQKNSTSQAKSIPKLKLATVHDILKSANLTTPTWSLSILYQDPEYPIKSNTDVLEDFRSFLLKDDFPISSCGWVICRNEAMFLKKYSKNIEKLISSLIFVNGEEPKYLYKKEENIPTHFASKDDKIVFLLTKYGSSTIFNTQRISAKNRAAKIISSIILPCMKDFQYAFKDSDISYYGMVVFFGSKDYSSESDSSFDVKPEMVGMIISAKQYKKYSDGVITDDKLLDSADIYSTDRNAEHDVKKIKIKLD